MNRQIVINPTKYSGLPLKSLIFLVKTIAPIDPKRKREVWKELFLRYFNDGRAFNLYSLLRGQHIMFANTITFELQVDQVAIPVEHVENFVENLLEFIDFTNRTILAQPNISMDWQIHELTGLQSMIERLRDAKIKDLNVRQRINLFIDNMNNARKKALLQIEAATNTPQDTEISGEVESEATQHILTLKEKSEIMKQELKHLEIPMSKVTKTHLIEILEKFHMYYPEDQKKIIRYAMKKYPHTLKKEHYWNLFLENLEIHIPGIDMINTFLGALKYDRSGLNLLEIDSLSELEVFIREWFFQAENATEEAYTHFVNDILILLSRGDSTRIIEMEARTICTDRILKIMDHYFWIIERYENGNLSDLLHQESLDVSLLFRPEGYKYLYNKDGNPTLKRMEHSYYDTIPDKLSLLDLYYLVYDRITGRGNGLASHEESYLRLGKPVTLFEHVPKKWHSKIVRFCCFPLTLHIDAACSESSGISTSQDSIESVLIYKFIRKRVSNAELRWLYSTREGYNFLKSNTNVNRSSGMFHSHQDYVVEFLEDLLQIFDFRETTQFAQFFHLEFATKQIYEGYYPKIPKEIASRLIQKVQLEQPHEFLLVSEFFDGIEEEYTEFEVKPEYVGYSDLELFLLSQQGINVGEEKQYKGYKIPSPTFSSSDIHLSPEEAKSKFIIDYYKNYFDN